MYSWSTPQIITSECHQCAACAPLVLPTLFSLRSWAFGTFVSGRSVMYCIKQWESFQSEDGKMKRPQTSLSSRSHSHYTKSVQVFKNGSFHWPDAWPCDLIFGPFLFVMMTPNIDERLQKGDTPAMLGQGRWIAAVPEFNTSTASGLGQPYQLIFKVPIWIMFHSGMIIPNALWTWHICWNLAMDRTGEVILFFFSWAFATDPVGCRTNSTKQADTVHKTYGVVWRVCFLLVWYVCTFRRKSGEDPSDSTLFMSHNVIMYYMGMGQNLWLPYLEA